LANALDAHDEALAYGGRQGISNLGLVESAIARPYNGYYRSIERKAAALVESVAKNHGFSDGNKRTAVILMHTLLMQSGYTLVAAGTAPTLDEEVENAVLGIVTHAMSFADLVAWFNLRLKKL